MNYSLLTIAAVVAASVLSCRAQGVQETDPVQRPTDTSAFFERTHGSLEVALEMFDEQREMPKNDDLAFYDFLSRTKESQQRKIEGYLEVAAYDENEVV